MKKAWIIKKGKQYYKSSLKHPETGVLLGVKWVRNIVDARIFKTKKSASEIWGENQKPENTVEKAIKISEEE